MMPATSEPPELAALLGAEAALAAPSGGAALVLALMACLGESGRAVVIQRGHVVDLGGSPLRLIEMADALPLEVGLADGCRPEEVEAPLGDAAAGLFVVGVPSPGLVDLPRFAWACRGRGRTCIAHLGRSPAWTAAMDAGADLVVLDLALLLGGTGGVVAGDAARIAAARRERQRLPALFAGDGAIMAAQLERWRAAGGLPETLRAEPQPSVEGLAAW